MSNERQQNVGRNVSDLKSNTFNSIEGRRNFMYYFESLAKESVDEILQKKMGEKSVQEELRNKFGEDLFNQFVELLRNDSEYEAINRMKWAVTPKTILGLLGYYLNTLDVEYEKAGDGYCVWEEDGYSMYEMFFRVDEKKRKITLTYDLEMPDPEDRRRIDILMSYVISNEYNIV